MEEIHIAGSGIWFPEDVITNDEIVASFNSYVDAYNNSNKEKITSGELIPLEHSSSEFIEKASGIKTRHVIDKKNILDINRMMPSLKNEDESRISIQADAGIKAAKIAMKEAEKQGVSLEITKLIDGFYEDIQKMGGSRWDTSSLLKRLQNND